MNDDDTMYGAVTGRNTADYLLRTSQQHHALISSMADTKANILITVSTIVLTLSVARMGDPFLRPCLITLSGFTLGALFLAVLAILPKFKPMAVADAASLPTGFNLLFFGHFSELSLERYLHEMEQVLESDPAVYKALVTDLYELGSYLAHKKYRYLRYSYICLLTGFLAALVIQGLVLWSLS